MNQALTALRVPGAPFRLMFTELAVVIGLVHVMVPLVVLSVWASLGRLDPVLERAATSLGAGRFTVFTRVVLPNVMPGIMAGALMVFCLSASAFATPAMLGGKRLEGRLQHDLQRVPQHPELAAGRPRWRQSAMAAILLATLVWTRLVERRALRRLGEVAQGGPA
ncbi:ABC transporter permease [Methylobacterium oryzae CBMB20]